MKMYLGKTPIKGLNVKHFEMDTNDCDMIASDMQAGKTAVARGKKITGTGKSFEFAYYGDLTTNTNRYIPSDINIIEVASSEYPIKLNLELNLMNDVDFSVGQNIASVFIDNNTYDLIASVESNILRISCNESIRLQIFYGKDNYV